MDKNLHYYLFSSIFTAVFYALRIYFSFYITILDFYISIPAPFHINSGTFGILMPARRRRAYKKIKEQLV